MILLVYYKYKTYRAVTSFSKSKLNNNYYLQDNLVQMLNILKQH
jgi:hypothetical protein